MSHYPGHLRDAFERWIDSGDYRDPSRADDFAGFLGIMWHCTDVMPGWLCEELDMEPGSSYARAAQRLMRKGRDPYKRRSVANEAIRLGWPYRTEVSATPLSDSPLVVRDAR